MLGKLYGKLFGSGDEERVDHTRRNVMKLAASSGSALGMVGMAAGSASAQSGDEIDLGDDIEVEQKDCDDYVGKVTLPARCIDGNDDLIEDDDTPAITSTCNEGSIGPCDGVTCCWDDCADWCDECVPQVENIQLRTNPTYAFTNVCNCRCS